MTDKYIYKPAFESKFKKHYKKCLKVVNIQKKDLSLPSRYNGHPTVNRKPERDLHIKPDWILIYKYDVDFVRFIDTGSHSDLFG